MSFTERREKGERAEKPQLKPDVLYCFTPFCSSVLIVEEYHMKVMYPVMPPVPQPSKK